MTRRRLTAHLAALTIATLAAVPANGQAPPRTPWGAPDLQGVWDFRTITPMERPRDLADQEFLTAEEAAIVVGGAARPSPFSRLCFFVADGSRRRYVEQNDY